MYYLSSSSKKALINPIADEVFSTTAEIDSGGHFFNSTPSNSLGDSVGVCFEDMYVKRSFTEGQNIQPY
jgi:hypothetical protein